MSTAKDFPMPLGRSKKKKGAPTKKKRRLARGDETRRGNRRPSNRQPVE